MPPQQYKKTPLRRKHQRMSNADKCESLQGFSEQLGEPSWATALVSEQPRRPFRARSYVRGNMLLEERRSANCEYLGQQAVKHAPLTHLRYRQLHGDLSDVPLLRTCQEQTSEGDM